MKTIGKTNQGNFLIEATYDEHRVLSDLCQVAEGKAMEDIIWRADALPMMGSDLTSVFGAIIAFIKVKERVSSLRNLLTDIQTELDKS